MATVLEKYATATVPRYTSYPPAPHFRAGFPATTYRDWLSALDPARPLSLYTAEILAERRLFQGG